MYLLSCYYNLMNRMEQNKGVVKLRQEANAPSPRVKQLEIHSLLTKTPRWEQQDIKRGDWGLLRPHISHSQSQ